MERCRIEMAKDIAKVFDAQLAYVESTYGNSVLDLQSNKVDLAFALNPSPAAGTVDRLHPPDDHPSVRLPGEQGLDPKTWDDIDKPELIKCRLDIGSLHEVVAKRFRPKAQFTGFTNRDRLRAGAAIGPCRRDHAGGADRADHRRRNPSLGSYHLLDSPTVALPSDLAVQHEPDTRFVEVINAWLDFNRGIGADPRMAAARVWTEFGVPRDAVPAD